MKTSNLRLGLTLATVLGWGLAQADNIQVNFNFNSGGPTQSLYDTYIFAAQFPGSSTNAISTGPLSVSNGDTIYVNNPSHFSGTYSYVFFGLYNDANSGVHVAVGTNNDLSGQNWDHWFNVGFNGVAESTISSELSNSANQSDLSQLAQGLLSYYSTTGVSPILSYGGTSTAEITGFSNGVNLGTATSNLQSVPEPANLLVLAGMVPLLLLRRRK
jgi:hypothetical protein